MEKKLYIKEWRKLRGFTQSQLSEYTGYDAGYICKVERGHRGGCSGKFLTSCAQAFECEIEELFCLPSEIRLSEIFALRERRKQAGLTQQEIADLMGLSQSYVQKIESGKSNIKVAILVLWASACNCSVRDLVVETKDKESESEFAKLANVWGTLPSHVRKGILSIAIFP